MTITRKNIFTLLSRNDFSAETEIFDDFDVTHITPIEDFCFSLGIYAYRDFKPERFHFMEVADRFISREGDVFEIIEIIEHSPVEFDMKIGKGVVK